MTKNRLNNDLYRTLVLTILAGLAVVIVSLANRDVYAKSTIDEMFQNVNNRQAAFELLEEERHGTVDWKIEHMYEDVQWLVRQQGGIPSAESEDGGDTPQ